MYVLYTVVHVERRLQRHCSLPGKKQQSSVKEMKKQRTVSFRETSFCDLSEWSYFRLTWPGLVHTNSHWSLPCGLCLLSWMMPSNVGFGETETFPQLFFLRSLILNRFKYDIISAIQKRYTKPQKMFIIPKYTHTYKTHQFFIFLFF